MAVPKRKMSRANTRTRRSTWKADLTELNTVKVAGREIRVPRRLAKAYKNGLLDVEGCPRFHTRARDLSSRAFVMPTIPEYAPLTPTVVGARPIPVPEKDRT